MISKVTGSQKINYHYYQVQLNMHLVAGNATNKRYSPYPQSQWRKLGQSFQQTISQVTLIIWENHQVLAPNWTQILKKSR